MLTDFVKKKRNLFDYKKTEFFKIQNIAFFSKGFTHAFNKKISVFFLFTIDQNKSRNNA